MPIHPGNCIRRSALLLAVAAAIPGPAAADAPFNQLLTFGVSYEDIGQFPDIDFVSEFLPFLVTPPGAGLDGSTGFRFTNLDPATGQRGRSWIELLAQDLGVGALVPSTPILYPGARTDIPDTQNINFAFGGARAEDVLDSVVGESRTVHPVNDQVPLDISARSPGFLQRLASGDLAINRRTLVVINSGGNDVRDADPADPTATALAAADTTLAAIGAIVDAGVRTIVIPTFPPMGALSESSNVAPDGSRTDKAIARNIAADAFNSAMAAGLPATGGNIVVVDWHRLVLEVQADPGAFGFNGGIDHSRYCYSGSEWSITGVECTEAPGLGKASGGDPDDFVLNDGLHPTGAMYRVLADYTASILRAPGMISLLPEAALADARAFGNTVDDYQARRRWGGQPDGWDLFSSVQWADLDYADTYATPGADADAGDFTIGAALSLKGGWHAGGALGILESEVEIDGSGSEFESSSVMGSLFLGYRDNIIFADLSLTLGRADLDDIDRSVRLGSTMRRTESGDTEADSYGIAAVIGVDMIESNAVRFGPYMGLDYLHIEVDGYAERSDASTAMAFGDQTRKSSVGSLGLFGSYPVQAGGVELEIYGDFSYRSELEGSTDDVEAVVKNLGDGVHFHLPGYDIDNESIALRAGVAARFGRLRCNLSGFFDDNERETTSITLGLSYDL